MTTAAAFAAIYAALYAAHHVGDHWVQRPWEAAHKGAPGWDGRIACARHVITLTITKLVALLAMTAVTGLELAALPMAAGLAVDAVSHYWADRAAVHADRDAPVTLAVLAERIGKGGFYRLGDRATAPTGTGAYALDQSWHIGWLFVAALIIAGGA